MLPVQQVHLPLLTVVVATLSRLRGDPERYRRTFHTAVLLVLGCILPGLAFAGVEARTVVLVLLGERWLPAVPLVRILVIAGAATAIAGTLKWASYAEGSTRRLQRWSLGAAAAAVVGIAAGAPWGVEGIAIGWTAAAVLALPPGVAYLLAGSPLRAGDLWRVAARPAAAAIVAGFMLLAVSPLLPTAAPLRLLVAAAAMALTYAVVWVLLPGGREDLRRVRAASRLVLGR